MAGDTKCCIVVINVPKTWNEADTFCKDVGGNLVKIDKKPQHNNTFAMDRKRRPISSSSRKRREVVESGQPLSMIKHYMENVGVPPNRMKGLSESIMRENYDKSPTNIWTNVLYHKDKKHSVRKREVGMLSHFWTGGLILIGGWKWISGISINLNL